MKINAYNKPEFTPAIYRKHAYKACQTGATLQVGVLATVKWTENALKEAHTTGTLQKSPTKVDTDADTKKMNVVVLCYP